MTLFIFSMLTVIPWFIHFLFREDCRTAYRRIVLHTWILSLSQIACTVFLLGLIGQLRIANLAALHLVIAGTLVYQPLRCGGVYKRITDFIRSLAQSFAGLIREAARAPGLSALILFSFWQVGWCGAMSFLTPVHRWDGLAYHLPASASLVASGSLKLLPASFGFVESFFSTLHLLYGWIIIMGRDTHLLSFLHWSFLILAGLATYDLLRGSRVSRIMAACMACCAMMTPILILISVTAYIDIAVAALFIAAISRAADWIRGNAHALVPLGCVLAFLTGAKIHTFLFSGIVLIWILPFFLRASFPYKRVHTIALLAAMMLLGANWMAFKAWKYGNPVYPFEIKIHGRTILPGTAELDPASLRARQTPGLVLRMLESQPGYVKKKLVQTFYSWTELGVLRQSYIHNVYGGFGALFIVLLFPAALLSALLKKKNSSKRPTLPYLALLGMLFLTPLAHITRYTPMIPFVVAVPAGIWLEQRRKISWIAPLSIMALYVAGVTLIPDWANTYTTCIRLGILSESARNPLSFGVILLGVSLVIAAYSATKRHPHWPAGLFLPIAVFSVLLTHMAPLPQAVLDLAVLDHPERLAGLLKAHELIEKPESKAQLDLAYKVGVAAKTGSLTYYTGRPIYPAVGLLWNRRADNRVEWCENGIPDGERIGSQSRFDVYVQEVDE